MAQGVADFVEPKRAPEDRDPVFRDAELAILNQKNMAGDIRGRAAIALRP